MELNLIQLKNGSNEKFLKNIYPKYLIAQNQNTE